MAAPSFYRKATQVLDASDSRGAIFIFAICSNFIPAAVGHWLQLDGLEMPELYLGSRVAGNQKFENNTYVSMLIHMYLSLGLLVVMAFQIYSKGGKAHKIGGYCALVGFIINIVFGLPMLVNSKMKSIHRLPLLLPKSVLNLLSWTTTENARMSHMSHHDLFIIFAIVFWLLLFVQSILQMRAGNLKLHKAGMQLVTWIFLIPSAQRWPNILLTIPAKHFGMERIRELVQMKYPNVGIQFWNFLFFAFSCWSVIVIFDIALLTMTGNWEESQFSSHETVVVNSLL